MDENTKGRLDNLVLELQKAEVQTSQVARELDPKVKTASLRTDARKSSEQKGISTGYALAIGKINVWFGTNYESSSKNLEEYFREKPCERD